jgi:hypothetical protein
MKQLSILIIAVSLATGVYADVIYDDQTFDYGGTEDAFTIWGEGGYETADDFEVDSNWTLEFVRVWIAYTGEQDIRVDIFSNGADDKPGTPPPGDFYYEEVPAGSINWIDTGYSWCGFPIYQLDIPIEGFYIELGTRYWLGLQSTTGNNSYWLQFEFTDWWEGTCFYYKGIWTRTGELLFGRNDCEFELHGTPGGSAVETVSLGVIKAGFIK